MTKNPEELSVDPLSKLGAASIALTLMDKYRENKFFRAEVFMQKDVRGEKFIYVVRTNLVNGSPPNRETKVQPPDKALLYRVHEKSSSVTA